ncbi:MAG TPA: glycoside hydrolase family 38 C-terminal domain-containing protein [Dictyoglomaceae bacterium]|nr:glycoside hydrolase family 38 C-terminal domain-containing protein [Dictyoglomaceae bacterium]HOL39595.1 glycoside hydrolase family 38 C-terminal domain-containing protein [Dictyoglomaceae bacterium]HPP16527.1 glycoside hydrolase family 38 C-terminal domain-containing protein [Dictyoglomaceae bacterium]
MNLRYLLEQWNFWLDELYSYAVIRKISLDDWEFTDKLGENSENIKVGESWKKLSLPVFFKKNIILPKDFSDSYPLYLSIDVSGESLIYIDNVPYAELNEYHKEHKIPFKKEFEILIEAVPKGLFGQHQYNPIFKKAEIFQRDNELYRAWLTFSLIREFGLDLENLNKELQYEIEDILEKTLGNIKLISSQDEFLPRMKETKMTLDILKGLWSMPNFPKIEKPIPEDIRDSIIQNSEKAQSLLRDLKKKYPNLGKYYAIGHSHIDYAWLWTREETIRKAQRTFSTMITLMDEYPKFLFLQSSAQLYKDLKEHNPYIFEKIREKVRERKWIPEGGMWVESDCQLPSGESLTRQLLYAQKFFEKEFGEKCKIAWLPDTFGFNANLPQILKNAGIDYFATTKLTWNETNTFPYDLFLWKGLDGTKIIAHIFGKRGGYNGSTELKEIIENWQNFHGKNLSDGMIYTFGYGDGGGGPTSEMIERLEIMQNFPYIPEIEFSHPKEFFQKISKDNLPTYFGDLYLELHRGTFTTQSRIKRLHRMAENHIFLLESLYTLLNIFENTSYPKDKLTELWEKLLRNEFHDILPGSSIREVYTDTERELKEILDVEPEIKTEGNEKSLFVYNATSFPQKLKLEIHLEEDEALYTEDGEITPSQNKGNTTLVYSKDIEIPALTYITLPIKKKTHESDITTDILVKNNTLENSLVRLEVFEDGTCQIFYKEIGRDLFIEKGNVIFAYPDRPRYWEAWDIPLNYERFGEELNKIEKIEIIEKGPLRAKIEVLRRYRASIIKQGYVLYTYSKRIDIETEIMWNERRTMVRTYFPININASISQYEIPYGIFWKPTNKNTSWEKAQFEIPVQRFIDLSQKDFGVSILNNGKYGHSIDENVIGITLLRSPMSPDYSADLGNHHFTYSIFPHEGDLSEETIKEAEDLNRPLFSKIIKGKIKSKSLMKWDKNNIIIGAVKKAEDGEGIIIRLVEYLGKEADVEFSLPFPIKYVYETNILEEEQTALIHQKSNLKIHIKPYQIKTLKLIY